MRIHAIAPLGVLALGALLGWLTAAKSLPVSFAEEKKTANPKPKKLGTPLVLPRPDFHFPGNIGRTYLDSDKAKFPQPVQPPKGAPNIVLILLDDAGFGQFRTFGGGVPSPTMDKLAAEGLRYNRFHTTALCSPTRAALITGRNHHSAATRRDHRGRHRIRRLYLRAASELRHGRRGAAPERLHDRLDRQEPQHARPGRPAPPAPSTAGPTVSASTISTASTLAT